MSNLVLFAILSFGVPLVLAQSRGDIALPANLTSSCQNAGTCSECLQKPGCAWCAKADMADAVGLVSQRCNPREFYDPWSMMYSVPCGKADIVDFAPQINFTRNEQLGKRSSTSSVRVKPQAVSLRVKPNEPVSFTMSFAQLDDYAVDLYYLMDLSKSMSVHKDKLSKLGVLLSDTMKNITSNFKLGFGSFIDKDVAPYCSEFPRQPDAVDVPYLFQHHMQLEPNAEKFSEEVKNAPTHTNLDSPEGGLEALMQAVVCENEIGWRKDARKLLIFSTDAGYHLAGDGRLAGITVPNDRRCHLNQGRYTHDRYHDYPSISQISSQIVESSVLVIFAVTAPQVSLYSQLAERIPGATVAELGDDSDNIVDIIKQQYDKISQTVEFRHKAPNHVSVSFASSCLTGGKPTETNKCEGLKKGSVVNFTVTIEATNCSAGRDYSESFPIYPVGINEFLQIDLKVICECPCEKPENQNPQLDRERCSGNGQYRCGNCVCKPGFSGQKCECAPNQRKKSNEQNCRPPNSTEPLCSGRGNCECGVCSCESRGSPDEQVWGPYCQCDNFSCLREDGLVCSGPDHGKCECGKCECLPGWTGPSCSCSESTRTCRSSLNAPICSGKGDCVCGKCVCHTDEEEGRYTGAYCEVCPECSAKCVAYRDCVSCKAFSSGPLTLTECEECSKDFNITIVDEAKEENEDERLCSFVDQMGCQFSFVFNIKLQQHVRVQKDKKCPALADVQFIVVGVMAAVIAVGLFLLALWKILTTIHDRLEYQKFERERLQAKWDRSDNPIYRQPMSVFRNPAYAES